MDVLLILKKRFVSNEEIYYPQSHRFTASGLMSRHKKKNAIEIKIYKPVIFWQLT